MRMLSLVLTGCLLFICKIISAQTLPTGFSTTTIGSGWNLPLGTAFTNDGQKLFVWEKDGRVYVCNRDGSGNYIKQATPVLDISEEVANWGDHGLMGFALDPNYLSNGLIYLLYVVDRHYLINFGTPSYNPNTSSTGATIGRITRYKTVTSGSNLGTDLSSRKILLGETKTTGICIMHDSHGLGTLAFAADGTLLASAGDGASYYLVDKGSDTDTDFQTALQDGIIRPEENVGAFRAQMLNCHNGKLLRIDPNTGDGVSSNPYYSAAQPRSPKSRVWAFGLRNPFRISVRPGTGSTNPAAGDIGEIYVGDVGWNTYEEVTVISTPGVNCGWPLFEGLTPQPGYTNAVTANKDEPNPLFGINGCTKQFFNFQDLIKQATADNNKTVFNSCNTSTPIGTGNRYYHQRPMIDWKHFTDSARVGIFSGNNAASAQIGTGQSNVIGTPFAGNCAVGGPFYTGTNFPAAYNNRYFAADHDQKWVRCFSMDFTDVVTEVKPFGTGFNGLVNINMNPLDGTLFIVELGNFTSIAPSIKQIKFGGNQSPIAKITSDKKFGPSVLAVSFTGNTSSDPDGTIASYTWNFGDGGTSTSANPSHNFTAPANTPTKYVVKLTVTDNQGASSLDSIIISVNNTPPQVNITSPIKNSLYQIGPDTLYACSATVSDDEHSGSGLKYEWQSILRHNSHQHPEAISNLISPTTQISRIGCNGDDYYWLIRLTVTDAAGLSTTDSSKIFPDCSPGVDNIPPVVSSVSPLNGSSNIGTSTNISATFNETIDPTTVDGTTFQLKDAANNIVNAAINTSFSQLTLVPAAVLTGSTVYTATIKGGASGVKDVAGNALVSDYTWSFTTVDVDVTPPTITSVLPANGASGISTSAAIIANFSEAINGSTINGSTFQLRDAANNLVPATISTASGQATLTPSIALTGLTVYTATITGGTSGIKDLAGNAMVNNFVWSFTTAVVDNVPPTVVSVDPANVALGVNTTATITANLSEAINPSTVTSTTFQLKDASNNVVAATVSSSSGVLTLTPASALATSTTYTATLSGGASGVKDLTGNALANNYSWSFTTVEGTTAPPVTIQSVTSKTAIGATSNALTGVPAGALLVLATTADAFPSDCIVSSSPALTWTKRVDAGASQSDNAEIWTAVYPAGGAITITTDWGDEFSQANLVYVVLNAEANLAGAFATAVLQPAPSVNITTTRTNSIIFGCTADWKAINGATRTLRDAATERFYFRDSHFTSYHYTKAAASVGTYTEGVSAPSNQQSSTALLEIRGNVSSASIPPIVTTHPSTQNVCAGSSVSFTSAATGGTPSVQWQSSTDGNTWTNIDGATNATLTFTATVADNNKLYRAIWTNSGGPVSSNPATLIVNSIAAPVVTVVNNCGSSELSASVFGGSLLWSNGATTPSIIVTTAGTHTVTQTVNGCVSAAGSGVAVPKAIPSAPTVAVTNQCGSSVLTASGFSGSLLWSTGEPAPSITVTSPGTYTVTQTIDGCTSVPGTGVASPLTVLADAPLVSVTNNCGNSVLTASGFTGSLLWSTGETTTSITVTMPGTYTVLQAMNGCISPEGSGTAAPIGLPATPVVSVVNNCESSTLTATGFAGSLLWSTGETTSSITVATAGSYSVTQTADGCTSLPGNGIAAPNSIPVAPQVSVTNNCGSSTLTATGFTGSLLWNTGETTTSITVTTGGTYTVTQTVNGCASATGTAVAEPVTAAVETPLVSVINNCGSSTLTATGFTGSLLWSTGETTSSITVTAAGTYTVTQTVNGCTSNPGSGDAVPTTIPNAPTVSVVNNCENSVLTASGITGSLLWSTGETTSSITVITPGTYTVTQTLNGCISNPGSGDAVPNTIPDAPTVSVVNYCGSSVLTATGITGSLLWSTGETTSSITVITPGTYTVTQTLNGCTSNPGSGDAMPNAIPDAPVVSVVDNCGSSILTATGFTGNLLWSTGETSPSITVTTVGTYTVIQTVNGCTSNPGSGDAIPTTIPDAPVVSVVNGCENSVLTASGITGSLLWSTGETTSSIIVTTGGTYTVIQTANGCTSNPGSGDAVPATIPDAPAVSVVNNCGSSILTATGFTGSLLWSTGETTSSITVTNAGSYTVTQTVNGCTSPTGAGSAQPKLVPGAPQVYIDSYCQNFIIGATDYTGTLLWSTGATTPVIFVMIPGIYSVTQTVDGCTSSAGTVMALPPYIPPAPVVTVTDNCESSVLTASGSTGSLVWSTGETTSSIIVTTAGTYTVTQTVDGCTSDAGSGIAAPKSIPAAPGVSVINNCGSSTLTASGFTGSLLWSTGETTTSITVASPGTYTVTQTVDGCTSATGSGVAAPLNSAVDAPTVSVVNNCGSSILTATGFTGSLLWSTGETTASITVTAVGTYTVTQTVNGCISNPGSGEAVPNTIPAAPTVSVVNICESSILTASGFTGNLLWSTGETTASITVATAGTYSVTQTVNGCISSPGAATAAPVSNQNFPLIFVDNYCGFSTITAVNYTGSLLWSTGETTSSITVTTAGDYGVTQIVEACQTPYIYVTADPNPVPSAPDVSIVNNCETSVLTVSNVEGNLLWSTGETTPSITVATAGIYSVTQTLNGCHSYAGAGIASPNAVPDAPIVSVVDNCGSSILTASGFTGNLLWSTGETTPSITVTTSGTYSVTQTVNGCTSNAGIGIAAPKSNPAAPVITVVDNCSNSVLTADSFTGALLWSTGETSNSITVTSPGIYSVSQTVNGCVSSSASGTAAPLNSSIPAPIITVVDNCGTSVLSAGSFTGSLLWSNGATTPDITVTTPGVYTATQIINGCAGATGSGVASPKTIPSTPLVTVVDNCGSSVLTATGFTGSLLWSSGATTASIIVTTTGTYTVTQTINGCTSDAGSGVASPKTIPSAPGVLVSDNCGNSTLTAESFTGTLLWSNGATTPSITVSTSGTYTVIQNVDGCNSTSGSGIAAPKIIPALSSSLTSSAVSGVVFTYTPTSVTSGTNFSWSRAVVTGISNTASSGAGTINETLINTTTSAINVMYVFTITANGCTNTQNVMVTVSSTPVVTTVSPINGATGIGTGTTIIANFSEAINGTTVTGSTFQLKDAANNIVTASLNTSSNQVTLTPSAALANSTTYTVTIKGGSTGIKGLAGNALANDYSWTFTTVAAASLPVTIQSSNTKTGTAATVHSLTGVPAGALLVLTTTSDAVVSNCSVSSSPSLTWTKRVDAGASQSDNAEIWTAVYAAGGSVTVTSNWGAVSQASVCYVVLNAEPTLSGSFGTATLQTAPSVTVTTTRENSIIFGCTADWRNINGATRTLRDAATERLYFRDGHYATYHYTKAATTIGAYTEGVSAPTGQQASTALLEIRSAVVIPDNTPPLVSSISPQNGAVDISISANASAIFNEAMNASTINGSTVELRDASNVLIATSISYNSATRTLTLTPSALLVNSTVYTVIIKGGISGVKDLAGNALVSDYNWSFTTIAADLTPPNVTSVTPANGATGISLSTAVSATFNEAMNAGTITNSTIELRNQSNILIAAAVSYNAATMTVTITPSISLANSTVYTITIKGGSSGVKDVAGNALVVDYSSSFTTTASVPQPPVTIQSVNTKTGTAATVHPLTGVPAGALLVLATTSDAFPGDCIVSSSPALTWTKRSDAGASQSDNAEIWTAFYTAGGSITVTSNWGGDHSQASVCYVVINAEPTLSGAFATAVLQTAPSVAITTTRENSIIFGCTADWRNINGATRTLRDAATERLYYRDGHYATYHYTKAATTIGTYTEGVSAPTGQQASTALLEIRGVATVLTRPSNTVMVAATNNSNNNNVTQDSLGQNYPNPFKGITNIPFSLSKAEKVNLTLYDINGRIVKVLVDASMDAGRHVISFNSGLLAGGIYYYRINAGSFKDVKKLIIW